MAYDIVPYSPELEPQIAQLQTNLWSTDRARNTAYFRWKYLENPFLREVLVRLAVCDGRVVAMRGMFGAAWEVDGSPTRHALPYADDFAIAPEHRNQRVARQIMQTTLDDAAGRGFPFVVSLSAGPVTFINSLAAGWRSAGAYDPVWRSPTESRARAQLRRLAQRTRWYWRLHAWRQRLSPVRPFDRLDRHGRGSTGPVSASREPRPEAMADLVARLPWDGRIRHVRGAEYFAWRFRNPLSEYRFLFWNDGGLQGYLVLQRYAPAHRDQDRINIADWEAANDRVRAGLLRAAIDWGDFARLTTWTTGAAAPTRALLQQHGFAPHDATDLRSRSRGLLIRRLGNAQPDEPWKLGSRELLKIADWDLRMLYSMEG